MATGAELPDRATIAEMNRVLAKIVAHEQPTAAERDFLLGLKIIVLEHFRG